MPCIIICVFLNHCCLLFLTGFCVLCSFILLYSLNFITSLPLLVIVIMAMHLDSASARYKADIMSKTIQARIEANRTSHSIIGKVGLGIYTRDPNRKNSLFMGNLTWVSIHPHVSLRVYYSSQEPITRRSVELTIVSIEQRFGQVHLESLSDISLFGKRKSRRRYSL